MAAVLSSALVDLGFSEFSPDNIKEQLPKIVNVILEDTYNPNFLQLMTILFGQLAPQFEKEILDLKLLQHVLPPTRSAFENCLLAIGNLLGDSGEMDEEETAMSISKSLQACLDILSGYGELLEVVSREPVEALYVRSLNENLPLILIGAFNHCKDSENCYGSYFEESTTILTAFFKKSYEIQTKYYKALEEKIVFSSSIEENITSLSQVLESVLTITETVVSLDIKTCVDQWKLYARLYAKHISDLKSVTDLSQPLALLTSNVQRILVELTSSQETTEKLQLKLLKMGNFLLKMVVKLCELSECRFREGMKDLVELLLLLHSCTRTHEMNDDLKEEVRRFICVGCAPLLALLLKEEDFFKAYNNIRNNLEELTAVSKVGMVFLNLTIMKSVVERKAPPFWSDVPLIESVTDLYNSCGLMVDANSQFEGNDAYSSMISITAAFMIATTDESSFAKLESFMVSKLLCGEIHTSIFVCDYLCLVGRLTSDTYCLHLATYLCEALNLWPNLSRHRPEYNIIGSLVHRLWNLLSQKSRETLSAKYTPEEAPHVHFWFEGTNRYAQTVLTKCDSFCRNPTVTSFNTLMASPPPLIEYEIDPSDYELVSRTFDFVKNVISFLSHRKNSSNELWCLKVFSYSLKLLPPLLSTSPVELVTEILEKLKNLVDHSEDAVELPVLLFLSNSVKTLGSASQTNSPLAHALTSLLLKLMESQDRVVASTAFDVWKTLENPQLTETLCVDSNLTERRLLLLVLMAVTGCITHKPTHGEDFNLTDALKSRYDKAKAVFEDLHKYYKGSKLEKLVQAAQKYRDKHMNDPLEPVFKKLASWSKPNGKFSSIYELYKQLIKTGNKKPNIDSEEIKPAGRMAANTVRHKPKKLQAARFMMYPPVIGDINSEPFLPNNGMEDPMLDGGLEGPIDPVPPPPPPPKKENKESSGLGSYDFGGGLSQKKGGKNQAGNEQTWPVQGGKRRESGSVTYYRYAG